MARRPDPARIETARQAAAVERLRDHGLAPAEIAAWLAHRASFDETWETRIAFILREQAAGRRRPPVDD